METLKEYIKVYEQYIKNLHTEGIRTELNRQVHLRDTAPSFRIKIRARIKVLICSNELEFRILKRSGLAG